MPDWEEYKEVECPECEYEQTVDVDDTEIVCDGCGYLYSVYFDED